MQINLLLQCHNLKYYNLITGIAKYYNVNLYVHLQIIFGNRNDDSCQKVINNNAVTVLIATTGSRLLKTIDLTVLFSFGFGQPLLTNNNFMPSWKTQISFFAYH